MAFAAGHLESKAKEEVNQKRRLVARNRNLRELGMVATVFMEKVSFQRASPKRKANSDPFWANIGSPKKG